MSEQEGSSPRAEAQLNDRSQLIPRRLADWASRLAAEAARLRGLSRDGDEDLASECYCDALRQWRDDEILPTETRIPATASRLADQERARLRRDRPDPTAAEARSEKEAKALSLSRPQSRRVGIPALCRNLAELARFERQNMHFLMTLRAAVEAVALEPKVLDEDQYRLFLLAYVVRRDREEMAASLSTGGHSVSMRAVTKRLERLAARIETTLYSRLHALLPHDGQALLANWCHYPGPSREKDRDSLTSDGNTLCELVYRSLARVIRRTPG